MEEKTKLKTPLELNEMSRDELITYIDEIQGMLLNYQIVIDQAIDKNRNVEVQLN